MKLHDKIIICQNNIVKAKEGSEEAVLAILNCFLAARVAKKEFFLRGYNKTCIGAEDIEQEIQLKVLECIAQYQVHPDSFFYFYAQQAVNNMLCWLLQKSYQIKYTKYHLSLKEKADSEDQTDCACLARRSKMYSVYSLSELFGEKSELQSSALMEEKLEDAFLRSQLNQIVNSLSAKEKTAIKMRFGFSPYTQHSYRQIAMHMDMANEDMARYYVKNTIKNLVAQNINFFSAA